MSDPNLNRPGYRETKVGWIPEQWRCEELQSVVDSQRPICYGVVQAGDHQIDGVACVRVTDLVDGSLDPDRMLKTTPEINRQYRRTVLQEGDIMVALRGEAGKAVLVPSKLAGSNLTRGVALVSQSKKLCGKYLAQAMSAPYAKLLFARSVNGTALQEISIGTLKKFPAIVPPITEQRKIAEILSTCDAVIEQMGLLINTKKRQKRALMQQLLIGNKRLPGFDGIWKEVKIGDLLEEVNRPVVWNDDELYRLISVRRRSGGLFYREALHGREILTKVMSTTEEGDFLISKMQVVHGAMAMTSPEFDGGHVSGSYITLVAKKDALIHMPFFDNLSRTKWVYHLALISSHGVVIEKMTFNLQDFLKKSVKIPPTIDEQKAISAIFQACEQELTALGNKLSALKQQKKGLMQKLLTGQIRVKI